jgi:hypothetical protein
MLQLMCGLILGKNKEDLVHSEIVPSVLKYRFYLDESCQSSFKFNVAGPRE